MHNRSAHLLLTSILSTSVFVAGCGLVTRKNEPKNGDGVNNGGDSARVLAAQAKILAPEMVRAFTQSLLPASWRPEIQAWLATNGDALATDIDGTAHIWEESNQTTCATTKTSSMQPISFSFSLCRTSMAFLEQAVRILIHESTHHFGIEDETFCDNVAAAVITSWKQSDRKIEGRSPGNTDGPPEAAMTVSGNQVFVNSLDVTLEISFPPSIRYMKISEERDFLNVPWGRIESLATYSFKTVGPKVLYYKVANADSLESSPYSLDFSIDLFAKEGRAFKPDFKLLSSTLHSPDSTLQLTEINTPALASAMMLSPNADFRGADWQDPKTDLTMSIDGPNSACGEHFLYLKYKTAEGHESLVGSSAYTVDCR